MLQTAFPYLNKIEPPPLKTWGNRLHTTDLRLATFLEKKETSNIWRQAPWMYVPTLTSSVRHPMTHSLPCDLDLCCSTWMGLNGYFHYLCLSLYLWTLSAKKSCGSDCMIRNQKPGWTLHWISHPRARLFSEPCTQALSTQGYVNLSETVSDFIMPNRSLPFLSEHQPF